MSRLFHTYFFLVLLFGAVACGEQKNQQSSTEQLTNYVNPFIGTDGPGNTYPGATTPFGMVQLSPDIGTSGWDRIAGYYWQDSIISGFSHTHLTGTGAGDLYDILVMPWNGKYSERIEDNGFRPFSHFSHDKEAASPGYYQVELVDFGINAELTATDRTGIHRYTFPESDKSIITVDLGYALNWDSPTDTHIKVVDMQTIEGFRKSTGWARDQRIYFQMKFSKPFESYSLFENDEIVEETAQGRNTKVNLNFSTTEGEQIILKTGLSTANREGAAASLENEAPHFYFDQYKIEAQQKWEEQLQKIDIETDNSDQKGIFYTMLYQSMLAPTLLSDYNGNYKAANDSIGHAVGFNRYDTFSLWDTYRAAHPLYTILHPERVSDMVNSMLAHYDETGLLPVWSMQGNETNMMIGYHAAPVIVDAYFKGIDFDHKKAYQACKASAMDSDRQLPVYREKGYIPNSRENDNWSVSKTLEYAYDDWCVAQFAQDLGKIEEAEYFSKRAENWKNLYDTNRKFFVPKDENGKFSPKFLAKNYEDAFCESNAWHYFWSVQHDIEGLMNSLGGKAAFQAKLDSMFTLNPLPEDKLPIFSTGMIGQYTHGNEPSHHVAYLYNYTDQPHKTQERVKQILESQYKNQPNGHCGNEDCGQMSSWYVLSSLGFYPVNPTQGVYAIGYPLFKKATIQLENGKEFIIEKQAENEEQRYIKTIILNGQEIDRYYITHQEIMQGGNLKFIMSDIAPKIESASMFSTSKVKVHDK